MSKFSPHSESLLSKNLAPYHVAKNIYRRSAFCRETILGGKIMKKRSFIKTQSEILNQAALSGNARDF